MKCKYCGESMHDLSNRRQIRMVCTGCKAQYELITGWYTAKQWAKSVEHFDYKTAMEKGVRQSLLKI